MGLFKPDFYRSFVIGFAVGAALLVAAVAAHGDRGISGQVVPAAIAKTTERQPAPQHPALADQTLARAAR